MGKSALLTEPLSDEAEQVQLFRAVPGLEDHVGSVVGDALLAGLVRKRSVLANKQSKMQTTTTRVSYFVFF